jgi:3-oxoacyl-[acyl-carrier-protein] synthase II
MAALHVSARLRRRHMTRPRTDICGVGVITGYGWGVEPFWAGLCSGKSAAVPHFDVPSWPWPDESVWAAIIADEGDPADGPSRFARALRASTREAITDALARGWAPGRTVGLIHAVVLGEVDLWRELYLSADRHVTRHGYMSLMPSTPVSMVMQEHGFHGPTMNVSAMCASGNTALLTAKLWLDAGLCDDVVVATTDISLTPENLRHFRELGVSATDVDPREACRPFQDGSRGFAMGEASVAFVVTKNHRPSLDAYATVLGGALTHDAFHVVSIEPSATQVLRCVTDAMTSAGIAGADVAWFNAHGPGTRQCDAVERRVLEETLSSRARVFSLKPLLGHCQGASSAVELAASVVGYDRGSLPAPYLTGAGHPRQLDGPTPVDGGITLKTALGMGGHNAAIVIDAA